MPYPLPLTRTEAYLAYKAGVIQQSDLKPSLAIPRNGIDAWLAYWTGLAADYPKREDGTPHILQEEEAYIAYLCGVINEYPEKCLRRVGAYLRYLISARWGRPDHPLNREELYLSLIKTQFIPSGDPSSDIEIDGTTKAPFVDVKVYGDTEQNSYTGKNLWPINSSIDSYNCTITPGDNSLTIEATGANSNIYPHFFLEADTQYTFSGEFKITNYVGASPIGPVIQGYNGSSWVVIEDKRSEVSDTNAHTFSVSFNSASYSQVRVGFGINVFNTSVANTVVLSNPQLEAGSTATDYEPYVGGKASPNPDYPQSIQTVTGRQVVKVNGKNLFVPPASSTSRGVTFTKNSDGSFNISGKAVGGEALCPIFTDINLQDGDSLTLSSNVGISTGVVYRVEAYNGNTWIVSLISQTSIMPKTITIPQNTTRLRYSIGLLEGREVNLTNVTFQLEKGTATAYEPYSSNDYEINLGKNLFDKSAQIVNGYTYASDGSLTNLQNCSIQESYIPVKPSTTYTLHTDATSSQATNFRVFICEYDSGKGFIQRDIPAQTTSNTNTITTTANTHFVRLCFSTIGIDTLQFEAGSTATAYAPYFDPIELNNIDDTYLDYIWEDGEDWKVHKEVGKVVKTGDVSESWSKSNSTANNLFIGLQTDMLKDNSQLSFKVYSDRFLYKNRGTIYAQSIVGITTQTTGAGDQAMRIGLGLDSSVNTVALFRAWLSENPTTVYYPLATPADTVITDQNLINQLNALKNGGAEEGTTYIKVNATDPNLPGLLVVEAPKYE